MRERGIIGDKELRIGEGEIAESTILIHCREGEVAVPVPNSSISWEEAERMADEIQREVKFKGGLIKTD